MLLEPLIITGFFSGYDKFIGILLALSDYLKFFIYFQVTSLLACIALFTFGDSSCTTGK